MTSTQSSSDAAVSSGETFRWRATNAPALNGSDRYNDVWFVNSTRGWTANMAGQILRTDDGGKNWTKDWPAALAVPKTDIRCLGFASDKIGWAGALNDPEHQLARTVDGRPWEWVDLPAGAPKGVCGLSVVDKDVVFAAGTNLPYRWTQPGLPANPPPAIVKTSNGGKSWTVIDMTRHADCLIDIHFTTPQRGWVVGAVRDPNGPTPTPERKGRDNLKTVVLHTEDGGNHWVDVVQLASKSWPHNEWGWKIDFVTGKVGYISVVSFVEKRPGVVLKTTNGGVTWQRLEINDKRRTQSIKGVGFVDENNGWAGGASQATDEGSSVTDDGGRTWTEADETGKHINQFRFLGRPKVEVGYAAGKTVYKYSQDPVPSGPAAVLDDTLITSEITATDDGRHVDIPILVPQGARALHVLAFDEFSFVATILEEAEPAPGPRNVPWDTSGLEGIHAVRVIVDDDVKSRSVSINRS